MYATKLFYIITKYFRISLWHSLSEPMFHTMGISTTILPCMAVRFLSMLGIFFILRWVDNTISINNNKKWTILFFHTKTYKKRVIELLNFLMNSCYPFVSNIWYWALKLNFRKLSVCFILTFTLIVVISLNQGQIYLQSWAGQSKFF